MKWEPGRDNNGIESKYFITSCNYRISKSYTDRSIIYTLWINNGTWQAMGYFCNDAEPGEALKAAKSLAATTNLKQKLRI